MRKQIGDALPEPIARLLETIEHLTGQIIAAERELAVEVNQLGITKAGPKALRWTLVQAAWSARRYRPNDPDGSLYNPLRGAA